MNSLLQIADACDDLLPILTVIRRGVFPLLQIGIPIILVILGTVDLAKAVISSDDKEVKAAQSRLIKRILYAAVIFFMTTIVSLVMNIIATSSGGSDITGVRSWKECWNQAANIHEE